MAVHAWSISYCDHALSDGFVPNGAWPSKRGFATGVRELVDAGLWQLADGGYRLHDYADYNHLKDEVLAARAATATRVERFRRRKGNAVTDTTGNAVTEQGSNAVSNASRAYVPVPVPGERETSPPYPPLPAVSGAPRVPAARGAGQLETAVVAGQLIELPNGAHQCPLCPEIFTGSYGDHLATSKRHKVRDEPEDFGRNDKPASEAPAEVVAELADMAARPTAEERYMARQREEQS